MKRLVIVALLVVGTVLPALATQVIKQPPQHGQVVFLVVNRLGRIRGRGPGERGVAGPAHAFLEELVIRNAAGHRPVCDREDPAGHRSHGDPKRAGGGVQRRRAARKRDHRPRRALSFHGRLRDLQGGIHRQGDGSYRLRLDGPASVLRVTPRYGADFARFLPALISCRDWKMHAVIRPRGIRGNLRLDLSSQDGLQSHLASPQQFDSGTEELFARDWGEKRDGWSLLREAEILHSGQKAFLPDFVFQHDDGRQVLMEIVGYWTANYLEAKVKTLTLFRDKPILLAIAALQQHRRHALPCPDVAGAVGLLAGVAREEALDVIAVDRLAAIVPSSSTPVIK